MVNILCSDCDCLRFRQHVGSYQCFGGTCCLHLQSPEDVGRCLCGGDDNSLLHCMFNIALDKWVEPLYNTVFVRLICFNPLCHHSHIIFLTILFSLGTWLHSSVGVTRLSRCLRISVPRTVRSVQHAYRLRSHLASNSVGAGHAAYFHWCWSGWHMKLTTHIPLVLRFKNEWSFHSPNSLHGVHMDNFVRSNQNEENLLENLFVPQKSSVDPILK